MATATKPKPFRLLGSKSDSLHDVHEAILSGLPYSTLARLLKSFNGSGDALLGSLAIGPKRLALRKAKGRLSVAESERVYRFAHLLELATELYEGSQSGAVEWLCSPAWSFSGEPPLMRARTEAGARQVEHLIGRLEHGVFS